jgi:branched-chain amino acid transport system substrate-binding protein
MMLAIWEDGKADMNELNRSVCGGGMIAMLAALGAAAVAGGCSGGTSVKAGADAGDPDTVARTVIGPVTVGFLMPATGSLADQAAVWEMGVQLAQTEINNAGGLMGRPLVLDIRDTMFDNPTAVAEAQAMLDTGHASALLTADGTAPVIAVLQATLPKPAIVMASTASGDELVGLDTTDSVFRTVASVSLIGGGTARAALDKGAKTMAILQGNNPYTLGVANAAAAYFTKGGGTVTAQVMFPYAPDPTYNYAADLATASAGNPDVIYLVPHPAVGISFLKAWTVAATGRFAGQWYLNETLRTTAIPTNVGVAATNGMRGVVPAGNAAGNAAMIAAFTAAYGTASGDPTIPRVAENYDAVYLMALAIAQAGTTLDVDAIRIALRSVANPPGVVVGPGDFAKAIGLINMGMDINYEGASGTVDLDDQGNVNPLLAEWQLESGAFTVLRTFSP